MKTLKLNVDAGEPRNSQRGRRPPVNDAALRSSFHTKMDGLRRREKKQISYEWRMSDNTYFETISLETVNSAQFTAVGVEIK